MQLKNGYGLELSQDASQAIQKLTIGDSASKKLATYEGPESCMPARASERSDRVALEEFPPSLSASLPLALT